MRGRTTVAGTLATLLGVALLVPSPPAAAAAPVPSDFNGDGRSDLVIGAARDVLDGTGPVGGFNVIPGTATNLRARGSQFWNQNTDSVPDSSELDDQFGAAFASGDFDHDGYDDLAVGAWCEALGAVACAGQVTIMYGSPFGLGVDNIAVFNQDTPGIGGVVEATDTFGFSLAAADFNGDDRDDLAIGAPAEGVGANTGAGSVYILLGGADGITAAGSRFYTQESVGEVSEVDDQFATALAAGDFDADGNPDLAVSTPREDGDVIDHGALTVIPGSATGLVPADATTVTQDSPGVPGRNEFGDYFGIDLAVGDFDDDTFDDLAVGIPYEDIGGVGDAGAVHLFEGSNNGLVFANSRSIWQGSGMRGGSETADLAGAALAAGDFDDDGKFDLAVGVPGETYSGFQRAGQVLVMKGTASGINVVGTTTWNQDVGGIAEVPEDDDGFGVTLGTGDFNGDGRSDLAIGVTESFDAKTAAGAVHVLYGSATGVNADGDQFFSQDSPSIQGDAAATERFNVLA